MEPRNAHLVDPIEQFEPFEETESFAKIRRRRTPVMPVSGANSFIRAAKRKPFHGGVARHRSQPPGGFHLRRQRPNCRIKTQTN